MGSKHGPKRGISKLETRFLYNIKSIFWYNIKVHIHIKFHLKWKCTFETRFSVSKFPARSVFYYSFYQRSISNGRPDKKTMCHMEACWRKMWKIVHFLQWYLGNQSVFRAFPIIQSMQASQWPPVRMSSACPKWGLHADSSGKTQSLWLKNSYSYV